MEKLQHGDSNIPRMIESAKLQTAKDSLNDIILSGGNF